MATKFYYHVFLSHIFQLMLQYLNSFTSLKCLASTQDISIFAITMMTSGNLGYQVSSKTSSLVFKILNVRSKGPWFKPLPRQQLSVLSEWQVWALHWSESQKETRSTIDRRSQCHLTSIPTHVAIFHLSKFGSRDGIVSCFAFNDNIKLKKFHSVPSDIWHVTCDMWHVTCDKGQVTSDKGQVTSDKCESEKWQLTSDKRKVKSDMWNVTCGMWMLHVTCYMLHFYTGFPQLQTLLKTICY